MTLLNSECERKKNQIKKYYTKGDGVIEGRWINWFYGKIRGKKNECSPVSLNMTRDQMIY